jgi:hypothetical protein
MQMRDVALHGTLSERRSARWARPWGHGEYFGSSHGWYPRYTKFGPRGWEAGMLDLEVELM